MEIRADVIKKALADRAKSRHNIFFTEVYTNDGEYSNQRFDGLEFHGVHNTSIYGYEVKVQRGDFLQDGKWTGYLNFCNEFSFVCPEGLIKEDELPLEVGLIYYKLNGRLRIKRRAVAREIKPPFKMITALLFNRIQGERHPFFSENREAILSYLADKEERKTTAVNFENKLIKERNTAVKECLELARQNREYIHDAKNWNNAVEMFQQAGLWRYSTESTLAAIKEAILLGGNPKLIDAMQEAANTLNLALKRYKN